MFYDDEYPDEAYDRDQHEQVMKAWRVNKVERILLEWRYGSDEHLSSRQVAESIVDAIQPAGRPTPLLVDDTCGGMVVPNESVLATDPNKEEDR